LKQAWNQSIIPQAFVEPALLHALLGIASGTITSIKRKDVLGIQMEIQQSLKAAAISMINCKLQNIWDAMQLSTLYTVIVLLGHEVSISIPLS